MPRLSKYEIGSKVAQGGMGVVLKAKDNSIHRTVAIKVMLSAVEGSEQHVRRFEQEAQVTGQLEHPNIVPVHELGIDEQGKPFYTMKFVQGVTLHEVLRKIKAGDAETIAKYPLAHLLTIFQKVCDAVAFAHSKGVIHRDLKPENIMIGEYGEVLVMDWGLAKVISHQSSVISHQSEQAQATTDNCSLITDNPAVLTMSGQIMGTPHFMSPEQAEGRVDEIDARTDIFALGAILYNILTLHSPVNAGSVKEILQKIRSGDIAPPTAYNPKRTGTRLRSQTAGSKRPVAVLKLSHCPDRRIPSALSAVTMKALAVRKENRYQSVKELQRDIEAFQGGFATGAEQANALQLLWLLIKRRKVEFGLGGAALLIILVLVTGFVWKVTSTLNTLRGTAPTFYEQAEALIRQQKFYDARQKIEYAIALRPGDAEYHYLKGNIDQTLLQMDEACDAYQQALRFNKNHALAKENLELCRKMLRDNAGLVALQSSSLEELYAAMSSHGRHEEANAILERVGGKDESQFEAWKTKLLRAWENGPDKVDKAWVAARFKRAGGLLQLDLSNSRVGDLTPLKGMPLGKLAASSAAGDLSPLKGMPLEWLSLEGCRNVRDLRPLEGMSLKWLSLADVGASDFGPLKGMPLRFLNLSNLTLSDLSVLKNSPLEEVHCWGLPVRDLGPLQGMKLKTLHLYGSVVRDLGPLQGMPLEKLYLETSSVADLGPLRGMPLRELILLDCPNVKVLSPLAECSQLEQLIIPPGCKDTEILRALPNLKVLSDTRIHIGSLPFGWGAVSTAAEFWKQYDAKKKEK